MVDNPSLRADLDGLLSEAYENGRDLAMGETNLPDRVFPVRCVYGVDQVLGDRFYPGEPSDLVDCSE